MPAGGRLTVNTSRSDGSFFITVGDTGVGVPPDKAGRVFDPFFTMKSGGLGLGLALTKRVVEEHGGKVSFKSEEGRGSTVSITLPAAGPEAGRRVTREA
jgi:signal transduction histidine kinase